MQLGSLTNLKIPVPLGQPVNRDDTGGVGQPGQPEIPCSIWDNQLTGTIPEELGNLTNLKSLYLSDNKLAGTIPEELGNLTNLEFLSLFDNQLTGMIPEELGSLINLKSLKPQGTTG